MEVTGLVKKVLDTKTSSGGKNYREFWLEIDRNTQYPSTISFQVFGDKCAALDNVEVGADVIVSFNIKGNEHNGKLYNSLNAWKITSNNI